MTSQLTWTAIYDDGSEHTQEELIDSAKIDREQLKEFRLYNDEKLVFVAFFDKHRKLIFRKRHFIDANGVPKGIVYLVGWHSKVKNVSIKSICYVYEDGHIEFDDSRNDLDLIPCEEI